MGVRGQPEHETHPHDNPKVYYDLPTDPHDNPLMSIYYQVDAFDLVDYNSP